MVENRWKKEVKRRDGDMCRRCGFDKNIHVHHILPKEEYSDIQSKTLLNGITLCGNCHSLLKGKETQTDLRGFLPNDTKIDRQLKDLLEYVHYKRKVISKELKKTLQEDNQEDKLKHLEHLLDSQKIAQEKFEQKDYEQVIRKCDTAILYKSDEAFFYYYRAQSKAKLGRYMEAIYDYDKALSLNPNSVRIYFRRAMVKYRIQNFPGAIVDYNMFLQLSPDHVHAWYYRGLARYQLEQYEEVIFDCDNVIEHKIDYANAYRLRGCAKLKLRQYQEAVEDFLTTCNHGQETPETYKLLADAFCGTEDFLLALDCLNNAIEIKDCPGLYKYRAQLNVKLGQYVEAIDDYDAVISRIRDDSEAYIARGHIEYILNRENEAFTDFEKAFRINPNLRPKDCLKQNLLNTYLHWKLLEIN